MNNIHPWPQKGADEIEDLGDYGHSKETITGEEDEDMGDLGHSRDDHQGCILFQGGRIKWLIISGERNQKGVFEWKIYKGDRL